MNKKMEKDKDKKREKERKTEGVGRRKVLKRITGEKKNLEDDGRL